MPTKKTSSLMSNCGPLERTAGTVWREVRAVLVLLAVTMVGGSGLAPPAASAEDNGVGLTPAMGWSSWSFLRTARLLPESRPRPGRWSKAGWRRWATST